MRCRGRRESLPFDPGAEPIDWRGWRTIDAAERKKGEAASRPRVKFVDVAAMVAVAKG